MRAAIITVVVILLALPVSFASGKHHKEYGTTHVYHDSHNNLDRCSIDMDDGTIVMYYNGRHDDPVVEITRDYELYVNGELIETNESQKKLLAKYYEKAVELIDEAEDIGIWGAKIGWKGAELGLGALASLTKLMDDDYDLEDYEYEMEAQAEKLEEEAERLEERAEELEDLADELEDIFDELEAEIVELDGLRW